MIRENMTHTIVKTVRPEHSARIVGSGLADVLSLSLIHILTIVNYFRISYFFHCKVIFFTDERCAPYRNSAHAPMALCAAI